MEDDFEADKTKDRDHSGGHIHMADDELDQGSRGIDGGEGIGGN